jgi:fucose 4-O-acetylase-like acetyltransferase
MPVTHGVAGSSPVQTAILEKPFLTERLFYAFFLNTIILMINSKNFDNIRSVALISVLLLHTVLNNIGVVDFSNVMTEKSLQANFCQILMGVLYSNLFKPGTILFFIISGFLFEKKVLKFTDFSVFVKKKAKSLLRPYLIIFIIPTFIVIGLVDSDLGMTIEKIDIFILLKKAMNQIVFGIYWFVPALFITLIVNYFIKTKDLFRSFILFGLIWLAAYINLYLQLVTTYHTVWFIGFFFIFTLGRLMYVYDDKMANLEFISTTNLIYASILFYIISNIESMLILKYGYNIDCINTLRIGNVLYSFSLFYLLNILFNKVNFTIPIDISFYFIYLVHPFVLNSTDSLMSKNNLNVFEYPTQYFYNSIHFLIVIGTCVAIQQMFFKLRFKSKYLSEYVFKK